MRFPSTGRATDISIHAPREGGDSKALQPVAIHFYFNPRPPRGGRRQAVLPTAPPYMHFNPRPPRGGRLSLPTCKILATEFQSTPPARGATDRRSPYPGQCGISIHAPREGGDSCRPSFFNILAQISIHAPREGGDGKSGHGKTAGPKFQSTPPARGATLTRSGLSPGLRFQSTPPARGATLIDADISNLSAFQSTPPARGATERSATLT